MYSVPSLDANASNDDEDDELQDEVSYSIGRE